MEKEILNEVEKIKALKGREIKYRQKRLGELAIKYATNLTNLKFTKEQNDYILNTLNLYKGELDRIMEDNITSYFKKIYKNHKFEFIKKTNGVQAGKIVKMIDNKNNVIFYYVKTHQHGSTSVSSTKEELDIKELYIYKLLHKLNIGSEVHWFESDIFENSVYIATKGLVNNNLNIDREVVKLDIITRILRLNDVMSNKSNILQHNDNKGYIIDFRILTIKGRKNPYLYDEIYESFLKGNETINYNYDKYFKKVMSSENNKIKIKYFEDIINKELNDFDKKVDDVYKEIKNDIIIKKHDNKDLLNYIDDIKLNYKNILTRK